MLSPGPSFTPDEQTRRAILEKREVRTALPRWRHGVDPLPDIEWVRTYPRLGAETFGIVARVGGVQSVPDIMMWQRSDVDAEIRETLRDAAAEFVRRCGGALSDLSWQERSDLSDPLFGRTLGWRAWVVGRPAPGQNTPLVAWNAVLEAAERTLA